MARQDADSVNRLFPGDALMFGWPMNPTIGFADPSVGFSQGNRERRTVFQVQARPGSGV